MSKTQEKKAIEAWKNKYFRGYHPNRTLTIPKENSGLDHEVVFSIPTGAEKIYYFDENGSMRKVDSIFLRTGISISYENIHILITSWNTEKQVFNYQIKHQKE